MNKTYSDVFCDHQEPLDLKRAQIEASRCYFCYDAPCIEACPTQIKIPSFIRKISTQNIKGAALDILDANIMGGTCARACPVEILCQSSCVRNTSEDKPVEIGLLQRFATDEFFAHTAEPFKRAPLTGRKVAVVGAGPAGLSCAHELARFGHDVVVFEARPKAGGLNEYGLAPYKMTEFAQKEVDYILSIGGITLETSKRLGTNITLDELRTQFDAVFLGLGLQSTQSLGIEGESLEGVYDAVTAIEKIRSTRDLSKIKVGQHVVVIGGGNTAIDISIQMKRLGAEFVTLAYRRDESDMNATQKERDHAREEGVLVKTFIKPHRLLASKERPGTLGEIEFEYTQKSPDGTLKGTERYLKLKSDQVFKAIGQKFTPDCFARAKETPALDERTRKLKVDAQYQTSLSRVFAGGDCIPGQDLTVSSVQHGKLAARAIHGTITTLPKKGAQRG